MCSSDLLASGWSEMFQEIGFVLVGDLTVIEKIVNFLVLFGRKERRILGGHRIGAVENSTSKLIFLTQTLLTGSFGEISSSGFGGLNYLGISATAGSCVRIETAVRLNILPSGGVRVLGVFKLVMVHKVIIARFKISDSVCRK